MLVVVLVLIIGVGVAALVYLVDWNDFKDTIQNQVKKQTGEVPLIVFDVGFGEFCQALTEHRLPGGVLYHVKDVPDVDSANRCMDLVRDYES